MLSAPWCCLGAGWLSDLSGSHFSQRSGAEVTLLVHRAARASDNSSHQTNCSSSAGCRIQEAWAAYFIFVAWNSGFVFFFKYFSGTQGGSCNPGMLQTLQSNCFSYVIWGIFGYMEFELQQYVGGLYPNQDLLNFYTISRQHHSPMAVTPPEGQYALTHYKYCSGSAWGKK